MLNFLSKNCKFVLHLDFSNPQCCWLQYDYLLLELYFHAVFTEECMDLTLAVDVILFVFGFKQTTKLHLTLCHMSNSCCFIRSAK